MDITTVSSPNDAAFLLNVRVCDAHTGVSMDGKMEMTLFLPLKSERRTCLKLLSYASKSGACMPTSIISP